MPFWGFEWGNKWGAITPELENPSFEIAGTKPGEAAGWVLITSVSTWEFFEVGDIDGNPVGFEDFNAALGADDPLTNALFGVGEGRENFEKLWGPFDGSDPSFPAAVPAIGYHENAGFIIELGQAEILAAEQFDWGVDSFLIDWSEVASEAIPAESFEAGWGNSNFIVEFAPEDLDAGSFGFTDPTSVESFEGALNIEEAAKVANAELGIYTVTLNGVVFGFEFVVGDEVTIVTGLLTNIANSNHKFTAASVPSIGASVIGFRVEDVNQSLSIKVAGPNNEDMLLVSDELRLDYWLLPDKTI